MDCQMPEMDGFEATAAIRDRERLAGSGRHTPIIAMTAGATSGDRQRCIAAGMDAYLAKPIKADTLAAMVSRWINSIRAGSSGPVVVATTEPIVDQAMIAALRELGEQEFEDLVTLFIADGAGRVAELRSAAARGDAAALRQVAHSLKGSSSTFGAVAMATLCAELEMLAGSGELGTDVRPVDLIATEFAAVSETLSSELHSARRP